MNVILTHKLRRLGITVLLVWATVYPLTSRGEIYTTVDNRGHCQHDYAASANPFTWTTESIAPYHGPRSDGWNVYTVDYNLIGNGLFGGIQLCSESVTIIWRNNPRQNHERVDRIKRKITIQNLFNKYDPNSDEYQYRYRPRPQPKENKNLFRIKTPSAVVGTRCSLDKKFIGIDLIEASPDGALLDFTLTQSNILAGEVIHMMIEAKGDEDWIELAANGTNFMCLPLADFDVGEYYEIDVPSELLVVGKNTYSYFLNSTGAVNSTIFFPLGVPADEPPTIGAFTITNSNFALQLTNLVYGLDYAIEQSVALATTNWQSVATFTATNDFHSLSVPMTNAAMFYRAAISPP